MEPVLLVKDHQDVLAITFQDMVKYHGREFIGGVALAFKLLELAFSQLSPAEPPAREKFAILIGVQGPGIIDGLEMVTRAKSRAAMLVDPQTASTKAAPDAADGCGGRYYFEITYHHRQRIYSLKHGLLPAEFITLAYKTHDGTLTAAEATRLALLKEEIAGFLLSRPAAALFDVMEVPQPE
ncbi:hypothetical protein [Sporomusa termitida]|uniref:Uncharacterized protein n=1 Tax=Sporomusa termitida TaxID=2377 RepID=A0A517DYH6_9FIRM|nr:hypothetical protein [Sporomusa termitida]QDR82408.1 hypothetical protein SPTER_38360 [Sporomusa termitida]